MQCPFMSIMRLFLRAAIVIFSSSDSTVISCFAQTTPSDAHKEWEEEEGDGKEREEKPVTILAVVICVCVTWIHVYTCNIYNIHMSKPDSVSRVRSDAVRTQANELFTSCQHPTFSLVHMHMYQLPSPKYTHLPTLFFSLARFALSLSLACRWMLSLENFTCSFELTR